MKHPYQIILISNNKQIEYMGAYANIDSATQAFYNLQLENKSNIKFPVKFINIGRKIQDAKYEIAIIKYKDKFDSDTTLIRNNFGAYTEYATNNDKWIVCDKASYDKEETFWVYGYHPLVQRKTFSFIFDNYIAPFAIKKDAFLNVYVFKNKLLIERYNHLDLITCKNKSDSIRLYNLIKETCDDLKLKYIIFSGDANATKYMRQITIDKIKDLTNWNTLKINRSTTRP